MWLILLLNGSLCRADFHQGSYKQHKCSMMGARAQLQTRTSSKERRKAAIDPTLVSSLKPGRKQRVLRLRRSIASIIKTQQPGKNTQSTDNNHRQDHHGITSQREGETEGGRERRRQVRVKEVREETDLKADPFLRNHLHNKRQV